MNQLSPEWFDERRGKVTASRVADLMAKTKSGYGASRANYLAELVAERLTGQTAESYTNAAMAWGQEHEQQARDAYEFYTGTTVEPAQFVLHPTIKDFGASPDGLIGEDGLLEVKCPNTATHIDTLIHGTVKYETQMQSQMACTGRQYVDFVSFDPRLPEHLKVFTRRVPRSPEAISEIEREVVKFLEELNLKIGALELIYAKA
jgi:putative phage-type endonuclease